MIERLALLAFLCFGLGSSGVFWFLKVRKENPDKTIPVYGRLPVFELTERRGFVVTEDDFTGHLAVVHFFFTSCSGPCPLMIAHIRSLHERFSDDLLFASVTVDPVTDTPEHLGSYASRWGADVHRWWFLTGAPEAIGFFSEGLGLGYADILENHSTRLVLIDRLGRIRGRYDGVDDVDVAQLSRDIEHLLALSPEEPGSAR